MRVVWLLIFPAFVDPLKLFLTAECCVEGIKVIEALLLGPEGLVVDTKSATITSSYYRIHVL